MKYHCTRIKHKDNLRQLIFHQFVQVLKNLSTNTAGSETACRKEQGKEASTWYLSGLEATSLMQTQTSVTVHFHAETIHGTESTCESTGLPSDSVAVESQSQKTCFSTFILLHKCRIQNTRVLVLFKIVCNELMLHINMFTYFVKIFPFENSLASLQIDFRVSNHGRSTLSKVHSKEHDSQDQVGLERFSSWKAQCTPA